MSAAYPEEINSGTLTLTLDARADRFTDLFTVLESLDSIITGAVRAAMEGGRHKEFGYRREALIASAWTTFLQVSKGSNTDAYSAFLESLSHDSSDSYYVAQQRTINSLVRLALMRSSPSLYEQVFDFARVTHLSRQSPIMLELSVTVGAVLVPPLIVLGIFRAVEAVRRLSAEADLRETEVELRREELRQRSLQTAILEQVRDTIRQNSAAGKLNVSDGVLTAAVGITSPAVAQLASSSLIQQLTVGVSATRR